MSMAESTGEQTHAADEPGPSLQPGERATGVCKWFSAPKGYGFISPDGDFGGDLFVHQTCIEAEGFRSLRPGEPVEFSVERGDDGQLRAVKVTGPQGAPPQGMPRRPFYPGYYGEGGYFGYGYGYGYGYPPGAYPPPTAPGRGRGYGERPVGYPPQGRGRAAPGRAYPPRGPLMPPDAYYPPPYAVPPPEYREGRAHYPMPGRPPFERRPPPGTPGVSSGFQVVVHNLPWDMTWQQLRDAFEGVGEIERADVIKDSAGNSRGFGIVRFATKELAQAAVEQMNNTEVGGRVVSVRIDSFA